MSRSNPNENIPNPCTQWMDWSGSKGNLKYFDKTKGEKGETVEIELPFEFILLDKLSTIKGWHDASESSIFANEVRDIRKETLLVRAFKLKEPIAEGFYSGIKDRVKAEGGKYVTNLYIAFTDDSGELSMGSLQFHGAALSAWMDFSNDKSVKPYLYKQGIKISKSLEGKKGSIKFQVPVFELAEIDPGLDSKALELDAQLQEYLKNYFGRARVEQADLDEDRTDYSPEYDQTIEQPLTGSGVKIKPRLRSVDMSQPKSTEDDEVPF